MGFCAVPAALPADPEGAKAPLPSPAPYYVAKYVPNQWLVLERNRFYRGERAHHVDRFVADLAVDPNATVDASRAGTSTAGFAPRRSLSAAAELAQRYGVNKSQFFVAPGGLTHVPAQHEPAALQEQPEASPGGQLRRQPQSAHARAGPSQRDPHRPIPGRESGTGTSASTRSRAPI